MKYLKNLTTVFKLLIIELIIYSIVKLFTLNSNICYLFTYFILTGYIIINNYNELKNELKNIKFDKKFLIISLIITLLSVLSTYIIANIIKIDATNNVELMTSLKKEPIIMIITLLFIGPISEELIFRYPFKDNNDKISLTIYTTLFALMHLMAGKELIELLYIIPYLLMSLGISLQYYKNKNIFTSIIYHIFNNLVIIMLLLL